MFEQDLYPAFKHPNLSAIISPVGNTMGGKEKLCMLHGVYAHFEHWGQFESRMKKHLKCTYLDNPQVSVVGNTIVFSLDIEDEQQQINWGMERLVHKNTVDDIQKYAKHFPKLIEKPKKAKR